MTTMAQLLDNFWFLVFAWITITSVAATVARAWQKVRRAEADNALKQEMLRRGLSVEEMERVVHAPEAPLSEEAAYRMLGECLANLEVSGPAVEEVMAAFRGADLPAKRAMVQTLKGILETGGELSEERLLAVVRGLGRGADSPKGAGRLEEFVTPAVR
jgi:hypothetical protein